MRVFSSKNKHIKNLSKDEEYYVLLGSIFEEDPNSKKLNELEKLSLFVINRLNETSQIEGKMKYKFYKEKTGNFTISTTYSFGEKPFSLQVSFNEYSSSEVEKEGIEDARNYIKEILRKICEITISGEKILLKKIR